MFVTIEGIEGAGKSTLINKLAEHCQQCGLPPLITREPGGIALGRKLRSILLDLRTGALSPTSELFLFMADRAQHVEELIRPALEAGNVVFCDRYMDSTIAYQGYGRGENIDSLKMVNCLATGGLEPDLTFLLDLPVQIGLERAGRRNREEGTVISEGRFDSESVRFHEKVREGYLALARENPQRMVVIDATQDRNMVFESCIKNFEKRQH